MKRTLNIIACLILTLGGFSLVSCQEDEIITEAKSLLMEKISEAENLLATTEEGLDEGDQAAGSKRELQAKIDGTDSIVGGDCHIIIYKCKASAIPINGVQSDFATYTFDGKGVFTEHKFGTSSPKAKLVDINFNAKAKDLTAVTSSGS